MSIRKNVLWNLMGSASPMLVGVVALPYILKSIGTERLGLLTIVWALIGYFSIFDFGLGRALTQRIAYLSSDSDRPKRPVTARSGLRLVLIAGLAGAVVVGLAASSVGVAWMKASAIYSGEISRSLLLACFAIPITTLTMGLKGILEGLELFKEINFYRFILGMANFLGPVLSIHFLGPSLDTIVLTLVVARLLVLLLHYATVLKKFNLWDTGSGVLKESATELLRFGSWMTLSNILSPLMVVADRFVIANLLGATVVAYYTVPSDFLVRLLILPAALTTALFPVLSRTLQSDIPRATAVYRKSRWLLLLFMLPVVGAVIAFSRFGLGAWLGVQFATEAHTVLAILAIGILFNSSAQLPYAVIQARGNARLTAAIHVSEFILYAPILILLVKSFGIGGAAAAWSLRALLDLLLLSYFANKEMFTSYAPA